MNPKEKFEEEKFFLEESPDKIFDKIKEKTNLDELEEWQTGQIIGLLEKDKVDLAVGKIGEFLDLEKKELEHLKKLPAKVIFKWFGIEIEHKNNKEEKSEE